MSQGTGGRGFLAWLKRIAEHTRNWVSALSSDDLFSTVKGQLFVLFLAIVLLTCLDLLLGIGLYIDINTYYYTYSTISQTLATAYGVLVAVTLSQMQAFEREIEFAGKEVIEHSITDPGTKALLQRYNASHFWEHVEPHMDQTLIDRLSTDALKTYVSSHRRFFFDGRSDLGDLKQKLVTGLAYTTTAVFGSLCLLTISQLLKQSAYLPSAGPRLAFLFLCAMLIISAKCLAFYYSVAMTVTKRRPMDIYVTVGPLSPSHPDITSSGSFSPPSS
jgi:hypothetical protein